MIDYNKSPNLVTRRNFLKMAGLAAAGVAAGQMGLFKVSPAVAADGVDHLPGPLSDAVVPSLCEMCVWRCGLLAKVTDGRIVKLDGNPASSHSLGKLCARGQSGFMTTYDPDRVLFPLIRVGERGGGRFRRATWEEALDVTAEKMLAIKDQYGPEAMVFSSTHNLSQVQFENLLNGFGSPNYGTQRSLCFNAMVTAFLLTYGVEEPARNYANADYILLTGRNLMEAISTSETFHLTEAISRGAKLVVLDPRFTKTAAKAHEWIPIRPGTDLAFHLALIHVIVTEQLGDCDFVKQYTVGCEELPQAIAEYTPAWAAAITGVPAETIDRIAREFASHGHKSMAHPGWRTSNFINSFQTERAIATLNAIVGNILKPDEGCLIANGASEAAGLGKPPQPPYPRIGALRLDGVPWQYPLVPLKLGIFQNIRDAILTGQPYQAHGWFIARQNPILSIPDRPKTIEAFHKMDFIVDVDILMNDTAWYADVVLPEASYLERYDPLHVLDGKIWLRQPTIQPLGEAKSALWIYKQLGERLGLGDYFQYADEEDYIRQQLAPLGVSFEELKQNGYVELPGPAKERPAEPVFNTPSGKVEIYSAALANAGFPGFPTWDAPPEPAANEFYLLTGKVAQHTQMATQNNPYLAQVTDDPRLWLNASVAAEKSIHTGDTVLVTSPIGSAEVEALVTQAIRPDCLYLTPGFGHRSKGLRTAYNWGVSDSDLHVTYTDPVSGGQALSQTFVTVEKIPA
ncbi:MAG: molybdopterin-dependent oxidoreductase [Chloroflexota bacterium]